MKIRKISDGRKSKQDSSLDSRPYLSARQSKHSRCHSSGVQFLLWPSRLKLSSHECVCVKLSVKQQMQHVVWGNVGITGLSGDCLMVPTGPSSMSGVIQTGRVREGDQSSGANQGFHGILK